MLGQTRDPGKTSQSQDSSPQHSSHPRGQLCQDGETSLSGALCAPEFSHVSYGDVNMLITGVRVKWRIDPSEGSAESGSRGVMEVAILVSPCGQVSHRAPQLLMYLPQRPLL